ncbi:PstA family ABC transporter permease [Rubritalea marina]|uniref:PstA family ABC transporter permease n=1 Tax=Rubritalea marina TaxID=361055 RepID=UPI00036B8F29|nr:ABC transporter permease subunit [Rubritalea marina]
MSTPEAPKDNPFCKSQESRKTQENAIRTLFIIATYVILLSAAFIFGDIIIKGTPVLASKGWSFIFKKPQTLNVIEVEKSDHIEVPVKNFDSIIESNAKHSDLFTNIKEVQHQTNVTTFDIAPGSVIGEGYLKNLEKQNKGFYLRFDKRDTQSPVAFTLESPKSITLRNPEFESLKASAPEIVPAEVEVAERNLSKFEVTIEEGEYPIGKSAHDALVPTKLVFQMRQTFADDEPDKINQVIIPSTQTITVEAAVYFAAFDEDERGTLPLSAEESIPNKILFHTFELPAGTHAVAPDALAILEKHGANSQHNTARGSIIFNNKKPLTLTVPSNEFEELRKANPGLQISNVSNQDIASTYISFSLSKDAELRFDIDDYEAITLGNKASGNFIPLSEKTHSYSGGGILGPIVGTALLVIICMVVALSTGIATSVFLNEYAAKGKFIATVRLAMLNLAGVPSIVFGLFGLGLFVILAPTLTSQPNVESKLIIPIAPIASDIGAREVEDKKIYVSEEKMGTDEVRNLAAAAGSTRFYDGWQYISFQGWGTCMLAGGFTLAIMVLPVIITSCEESLSAVPMGFREASLALGATKWQSIRTAVLPYAFPGILTASILGITRVAGETAPIMFTAAVAERSDLPWQGINATGLDAFVGFLQQSVQALPYHIYTVAGRIPQSEYTEPMQYGSVLVFMMIVMTFAAFSVWLRIRIRNKIKW